MIVILYFALLGHSIIVLRSSLMKIQVYDSFERSVEY